jgi:GMP synthase (glutamine-hydrolysing)
MRLLYLSQLLDPADPRRATTPREADTMPPIFAALGATLVVHDATLAPPPPPDGFDGVVVGGSFGSANDTEPWRVALREWLDHHLDVPLFGICGGHQLLARALGAVVERAPAPQLGVFPLALDLPGFLGQVVQLHGERVAAPPPGAEVWASDDMGIQALRYGPTRWTTQFHPEMDAALARMAGAMSGMHDADWDVGALAAAVVGGRAMLVAWLANVRAAGSRA